MFWSSECGFWTIVRYCVSHKCRQIKVSIMIHSVVIRCLGPKQQSLCVIVSLHISSRQKNPESSASLVYPTRPYPLIASKVLPYRKNKSYQPETQSCSSITNSKLIRPHHLLESASHSAWQVSMNTQLLPFKEKITHKYQASCPLQEGIWPV